MYEISSYRRMQSVTVICGMKLILVKLATLLNHNIARYVCDTRGWWGGGGGVRELGSTKVTYLQS